MEKDYGTLRLAIVNGCLGVREMLVIAAVAENYGKGTIHLTIRQGVDIPFIPGTRLSEAVTALRLSGVAISPEDGSNYE